jgi:hypothetical protein
MRAARNFASGLMPARSGRQPLLGNGGADTVGKIRRADKAV